MTCLHTDTLSVSNKHTAHGQLCVWVLGLWQELWLTSKQDPLPIELTAHRTTSKSLLTKTSVQSTIQAISTVWSPFVRMASMTHCETAAYWEQSASIGFNAKYQFKNNWITFCLLANLWTQLVKSKLITSFILVIHFGHICIIIKLNYFTSMAICFVSCLSLFGFCLLFPQIEILLTGIQFNSLQPLMLWLSLMLVWYDFKQLSY